MQHAVRSEGATDQTGGSRPNASGGIARSDHRNALGSLAHADALRQTTASVDDETVGSSVDKDASADVAAMRAALGLQTIVRYLGQHYWGQESAHARAADQVEPGLKLENVAAHSWQVADAALLLAPHFPELRVERVVQLAILHDKLEMITGDFDPVGSDGRGTDSHAFNPIAQSHKRVTELRALESYLNGIREPSRSVQRELLLDAIDGTSVEARFVKAVDKLQALIYVIEKKKGSMSDEHVDFSIRYSGKAIEYFPGLIAHCRILFRDLLRSVAAHRDICVSDVEVRLSPLASALVRCLRQ